MPRSSPRFRRHRGADRRIAEEDRRDLPSAAEDDQVDPELEHVDAGPEHAAEVEELRPAVRSMVVVYRHLDGAEARVLDLAHHLETNDAGVALEPYAVEDLTPHQAEVAVDIAHAQM